MDLNFTAEEQAFREEVRSFVREHLDENIRHKVHNGLHLTKQDHVSWQRALHARGWGAPGWPKEFGGPGWGPVQQYIFDEECAAGGAPRLIPFGLKMVAPVIMAFGNAAQQQRFLPKIASAEEWWCQGYSEPGAGSDLASLRTRARRDGDHYVVNGQKTWNTLGQHADWIFCLVRTDTEVKPQRGISFLLIDMKSPGITVRPIITLDGAHEVNEVWFEDVRVPVENLVGEENQGWTYAKFLLGHERTNIAGIGIAKRELARLKRIAAIERKRGRPLIEDPLFAARLAELEIELMALELTNLRVLSAEAQKRAPGPEASILKIKGTEIQQGITELLVQAVGPYALPFRREALEAGWQDDPIGPSHAVSLAANYLNMRKLSIYGGSNEIQKNIISQRLLGL
ncbi:acyl-CoA dehydrogenase family protein [Aquabacterium sp. A7-Y]|uniref:acyl-CoA dehydrogenase family protein n=1 Tax=Aquabacterium sp. A7-Y TaxID=1349605 RepID=UPI00223D8697|nr:acyl-CoA dehydrogenase family protein [Aquabacterium sp. A7-Y]MCW7536357.1 acyl-CoA dehydrogenase family protein [Aquabacterium sp. A7-Y]